MITMRSRRIVALLSLAFVFIGISLHGQEMKQKPSTPEFDRMKTLTGTWKGKDPQGKPVDVAYKVVSEGMAIMETLGVEDHAENMVTMYHLDHGRLMLTHYCSMGNQPRLQYDAAKSSDSTLVFTFRDATNMESKDEAHIHGLTIIFRDKTHFAQEWVSMVDGKEAREVFAYERAE